jgi:hypothetical protein
MIMIGIARRTAADFFSIPGKMRGNVSARAVLIAVEIAIVVGALISLSGSSETISEKRRDEMIRQSDDQSWRFELILFSSTRA